MKRVFTFLLLLSSMMVAHAATYVSGVIAANTTWTLANSPYIVNGGLAVDSGVTLTIQPGVMVKVDSTMSITIDGRLIAEGTVTDSITFTSNSTNPARSGWPGLSFRIKARNDTSRFKYCKIEYAGIGIYNAGTSTLVYNSVLRHCSFAAIYLTTPSLPTNCYNAINKCLITQNDKGVWDSQNTPIPGLLSENYITYNSIGYFAQSSSNGMVTTNNNFFYNGTGVSLQGGNVRGLRFNNFKGNSSMALAVVAGTIYTPVSNNLFIYNDIALWLSDVMTASVANNTIAYNNQGIYHNQNSFNLPNPSGMVISNNCMTNNVNYNFRENSTVDFQATNNWWGDTAIAHIDSFIYDHYDSVALGRIAYVPVLTTASGCQAVTPPPPCTAPALIDWKVAAGGVATAKWHGVSDAREYEYYTRTKSAPVPAIGVATSDTAIMLNGLIMGETYIVCVRTRCWQQPFFSEWACDTLKVPISVEASPVVSQLRIYPNPNNGVFVIDIPAGIQAGEAAVLDVNGRILQSKKYTAGTKLQFDMNNAAKGVYVVRFTAGTTTLHATMVVN